MEEQFKTMTQAADAPGNQAVQVEIGRSFQELESIRQEWDTFVESVGSEIFLTYDWCRIWWKHYGKNRDLKILLFRCNRNLIGILPLFFERIWLGPVNVRTGKIVGSDFTISHFSMPVHSQYLDEVVEEFYKVVSQQKWDILCLGQLAGLYTDYEHFCEAIKKVSGSSYIVTAKQTNVQTYFPLAETWENQLKSLKKGERWDVRRSYKAIDSITDTIESSFALKNDFKKDFQDFVNIHQTNWQNKGNLGHFGDWPGSEEFHREVAEAQLERGRLRLLKANSGRTCLGYEYCFKHGSQYLEFLNARSQPEQLAKISVGKVVFSEMVKKAIDENIAYVDSMQCKYDHKLRLGGKLFPMRTIYICRKGAFVRLQVSFFRLLSKFLDLCYFKIWYCRIAPKLPFKRKPLWRIWIRSNAFAG